MKQWAVICTMLALAAFVAQFVGQDDQTARIGSYTTMQFNTLGREQQILVCAGCHPSQYENEQMGPHAHSYRALTDLDAYLTHSDYDIDFYAAFVGSVRDAQCMGCHAPEYLFSAIYSKHLTSPDSLIVSWHESKPKLPKPRTMGRQTGVDCLTCHYDGREVITSDGFSPLVGSTLEKSCNPRPSAFFSSDYSCYACHTVSFEGREPPFGLGDNGLGDSNHSCISCHQQYDTHGKGTHYYYWKHGTRDRPKPSHLAEFFAPCDAILKGDSLVLKWTNSLMPHPMSRAPEWFLDISISDSAGTEFAGKRIYINRKQEHDRTVLETFGSNVLPGQFGFDPLIGDTFITTFPLERNVVNKGLRVNIVAYSKSQYWHHDSIGVRQVAHQMEVK